MQAPWYVNNSSSSLAMSLVHLFSKVIKQMMFSLTKCIMKNIINSSLKYNNYTRLDLDSECFLLLFTFGLIVLAREMLNSISGACVNEFLFLFIYISVNDNQGRASKCSVGWLVKTMCLLSCT